jgi:crotonobetainyl-CoA:carnitine CoA-transferase CaiB-like acyl-CoA transferase
MTDTRSDAGLPLKGIRVLDLTRALAGPFCTALLGDFGADIVKVETPSGEVCRQWGPWQNSESLYFLAANRNKRSLAIDMWSEEGRRVLREMAPHLDVVVENFRPGVLDDLGLGADWFRENHPHVIVASLSGFGQVGPRAKEACFDQVALGFGGLMSITGTEESGPMRSGIPLADTLTGIFGALGICAALVKRRDGQTVQTSLLESVIGVLTFQGQRYLSTGEVPEPVGNDHPTVVPYGVFRTATQPINLAAGTGPQWHSVCEVIGAPELANDPRFAAPPSRAANKALVKAEIESRLVREPAAHWLAELTARHVPCGPINDIGQTFAEAQVEALGIVQHVEHPRAGDVPMARGPLWMDGRPTPIQKAAPVLGADSVDVLKECGFSSEQIDGLLSAGTVAEDSVSMSA